MEKHVVSFVVANHPGVLCRVSGLFSRRGYNIESITAGVTYDPSLTRMTVVVTADERMLEQVVKQLDKLVDVREVKELPSDGSVLSEIALIKIKAHVETNAKLMNTLNRLDMQIVDVGQESITLRAVGDATWINEMIAEVERFGIIEIARTGMVALERGDNALLQSIN